MQLTRHTDYALRLLIYLAGREDRRVTIAEIARSQAISRTHLMKITNELARAGFVDSLRGRGGGICLGRDPGDINLSDVVQAMEPNCPMVDCTACRLVRRCNLPGILGQASLAFQTALAKYSLADLIDERRLATAA